MSKQVKYAQLEIQVRRNDSDVEESSTQDVKETAQQE